MNINDEKFISNLMLYGMEKKRAIYLTEELVNDIVSFPVLPSQTEWAMRRGFLPGRIPLYGLTEENYHLFLPDYNYFMMHPLNNHFKIWVNDKLTLKYCLNCSELKHLMPEYYLYIENDGKYTYLMDAPENIRKDEDFIYNLLCSKKKLAIKPCNGSGGIGFLKAEIKNGEIHINGECVSREEFNAKMNSLTNTLFTEFVMQHPSLASIWDDSVCTLRVIMVKSPTKTNYEKSSWHSICSYARFGTKKSFGASNLSSGGIGIGFDYSNGKFYKKGFRYKYLCSPGEGYSSDCHPDSKFVWEGFTLPNWEIARSSIQKTCDYLSSLDFLGFDVIITPDGISYCEINTHPSIVEQIISGPILQDKIAQSFFESKNLHGFDGNQFYRAYVNALE